MPASRMGAMSRLLTAIALALGSTMICSQPSANGAEPTAQARRAPDLATYVLASREAVKEVMSLDAPLHPLRSNNASAFDSIAPDAYSGASYKLGLAGVQADVQRLMWIWGQYHGIIRDYKTAPSGRRFPWPTLRAWYQLALSMSEISTMEGSSIASDDAPAWERARVAFEQARALGILNQFNAESFGLLAIGAESEFRILNPSQSNAPQLAQNIKGWGVFRIMSIASEGRGHPRIVFGRALVHGYADDGSFTSVGVPVRFPVADIAEFSAGSAGIRGVADLLERIVERANERNASANERNASANERNASGPTCPGFSK